MFRHSLFLLLSFFIASLEASSVLVQDGVYTRVTVQIQDQAQPSNCVEFLDHLEAVLNETSYGLHRLTQRQGLIKEFDIILPKSWHVPSCEPGRQMTSVQRANPARPDIFVDAKAAADNRAQTPMGPRPWTEQPQGCGQPGYAIHLPSSFLNFASSSTAQRQIYKDSWELRIKGQVLLKEWCKYRYGIFPESGFSHDKLYPLTYPEGNNTIASKGCIQQDVVCPLGQVYNRAAPTKQNLLCNEQSAIETILNHPDFQTTWESIYNSMPSEKPQLDLESAFANITENSTTTTSTTTKLPPNLVYPVSAKEAVDPTFNYVVPKSSRYVILLERTSVMNVNSRWTNIRRALYRFIQYLPTGSELSIISYGSEAKVDLPPTVVTDANREGLHGRIPRKVIINEDNACTSCALNASLKALHNFMGQLETGTLILVSGSNSDKAEKLGQIWSAVQQVPLQVFPILYPSTGHSEVLNLAIYGKAYSIPEGEENVITPLNYLSEVLLDILHLAEDLRIQKVHETKHLSYEFAGTFTMEQDILHKMHVTLSVDDEDKVEFFEVTNPSGKKHLFSQFEDGMVVFNHPGIAQAGIWTYHAKLYPNTGLSSTTKMTVDVVSQSNNADAEPFMLEVFTNAPSGEVIDAYNDVMVLYARLTKGNTPVIGANVRATIFRPGGPETNPPVVLMMRDNGAGYPDITAEDGIYSVYFSHFATVPGFYSVQVSADNNGGSARTPRFSNTATISSDAEAHNPRQRNIHGWLTEDSSDCCGSRVDFGDTIPAASFMRQAAGPAFYVKQGLSGRRDVAPPSRVIDFHVSSIVNDSLYVELGWSAPGDDYDQGKAFKYEIRCYTNREALNEVTFTEKGILVHDSFTPQPLEYGSRQSCTVGVPWPNEIFYYALLAIDEAGNRSPISNIISVYIYEAPTTTTTSTTTTTLVRTDELDAVPLFSSESVSILTDNDNRPWSKHVRVYIATGVICGLLCLIIAVIIFVLIRVKAKRTTAYDTEARDSYKAYEPSSMTTNTTATAKANDKSLSSWLDSLPRSEMHNTLRSDHCGPLHGSGGRNNGSPNTSHELSLNDSNGTLKRNGGTHSNTHTLTKTNPYRHKVLTNGSFLNLNLKDVVGPLASTGSDDASNSSRPTTSTEDTNSDSGNENHAKQLRRSKSSQASRFAAPDLLPPPDGFDNSQYPIDTSTAKAIIDTYSGHLFSRSTNYYSFRGTTEKKYPSSAVETLFTRDPTNFEHDSLEDSNRAGNYYDRHTVVVKGPPNNNTATAAVKANNNNTAPRVKTRTESVV